MISNYLKVGMSWHSTVVFRGSDNATQSGYSKMTKTTTVETYIKNVLDTFGIKDVLATLEFVVTGHTADPDEYLMELSDKFGYVTTIYTDASLPNKPK